MRLWPAQGPMCTPRQLLPALIILAKTGTGQNSSPNLRGSLDQVLVFDAGSSGTRIHIFNLVAVGGSQHVPYVDLSVRNDQNKKVKPGLSHYATHNDGAGARKSIEELLAFADNFVAKESRKQTPALLKATAGLRAVSDEQADSILKAVREGLTESEYKFVDSWADIIKGKEEAGLAWVAANYLQGSFSGTEPHSTIGVIEMGGGSTQVSFEVESWDGLPDSDHFAFTTSLGKEYHLYAHSYLGFGQDHAQQHLRERLYPETLSDPCYERGYKRPSKSPAEAMPSAIEGQGSAEDCEALIKQHLFESDKDAPGKYSAERAVHGSVVATENFYYLRNDLGLPFEGAIETMRQQAKDECSKELHADSTKLGMMQNGTWHPHDCFGLAYQVVLLQELKAFPPGARVSIMRQINGGDIDWALGAAVIHFLQSQPLPESHGDFFRRVLVVLGALAMIPVLRAAVGPLCAKKSGPGGGKGAAPGKGTVYGRRMAPAE